MNITTRPSPRRDRKRALTCFGAAALLSMGVAVAGKAGKVTLLFAEEHEENKSGATSGATDQDEPNKEQEQHEEEATIHLSSAAVEASGIRVEAVALASLQKTLRVPGVIEGSPSGVALISPPVSGRVVRVLVNVGDTVRAGAPLVELSSAEYAEALAGVRAHRAAFERSARLYKEELVSRAEMEETELSLHADEAKVAEAEAGGAKVVGNQKLLVLSSPISGVVAERKARIGEVAQAGAALLTVENLDSVVITAQVPEPDISRVRVGGKTVVFVSAYPDHAFSGIVRSVSTRVDEKTRTLSVRADVPNLEHLLRLSMFAEVTLLTGTERQALTVPLSALTSDESGAHVVYVAEGQGFEKRVVEVGETTQERAEITRGLTAGESVVVHGAFILKSEASKGELKGDDD